MPKLYCITCRRNVSVQKQSTYTNICFICSGQTLNLPLDYLRKQPASISIQQHVNLLFPKLIKGIEQYIEENPKKGFFSRSSDEFISVIKDYLWALNVTMRSAESKVGKYEKAMTASGHVSDNKLQDYTLNQIGTIEHLHVKIRNRFSNPDKAMSKLLFYPTIHQLSELRSNYMMATYGGIHLPNAVVEGFDES